MLFDYIRFDYRMPDGFDGYEFQSRDLECACDPYEVNAAGRLMRLSSGGGPDGTELPVGDLNYSGELNIYTNVGFGAKRTWHDYNLTFVDGTLTVIKCNRSGIDLLFDPNQWGHHSAEDIASVRRESERLLAQMDANIAARKGR